MSIFGFFCSFLRRMGSCCSLLLVVCLFLVANILVSNVLASPSRNVSSRELDLGTSQKVIKKGSVTNGKNIPVSLPVNLPVNSRLAPSVKKDNQKFDSSLTNKSNTQKATFSKTSIQNKKAVPETQIKQAGGKRFRPQNTKASKNSITNASIKKSGKNKSASAKKQNVKSTKRGKKTYKLQQVQNKKQELPLIGNYQEVIAFDDSSDASNKAKNDKAKKSFAKRTTKTATAKNLQLATSSNDLVLGDSPVLPEVSTIKSSANSLVADKKQLEEQQLLEDEYSKRVHPDTKNLNIKNVDNKGREVLNVSLNNKNYPKFSNIDSNFWKQLSFGRNVIKDEAGKTVHLTLNPALQAKAQNLLSSHNVPWGAIVAIEPSSGKVLAVASFSANEPERNIALSATFPAASLFKLITSSAAIEHSGLDSDGMINFRGGVYTLGPGNFLPNTKLDNRSISFANALGKSCNPAFARIALNHLSKEIIEHYALSFGFNKEIPFELPLEKSSFKCPEGSYEVARTAAGFGNVKISPVHAALITAAIANGGKMMRPTVIEEIKDNQGKVEYASYNQNIARPILSSTANQLMGMMTSTIETGTASKYFRKLKDVWTRRIGVAAKTGTLSGDNPKGLYHWFVASAPLKNPKIAIATLIIDPGNAKVKASALGKAVLEEFFFNSKIQVADREIELKDNKKS